MRRAKHAQDGEEEAQCEAPEHGVPEERTVEPDDLCPLARRSALVHHEVSRREGHGVDRSEDGEGFTQADRSEHLSVDEGRDCPACQCEHRR